jgi:hypothetical protein
VREGSLRRLRLHDEQEFHPGKTRQNRIKRTSMPPVDPSHNSAILLPRGKFEAVPTAIRKDPKSVLVKILPRLSSLATPLDNT